MSILAKIRREEKKVEMQHDLIGLQSAAKVLDKTAGERSLAPRNTCYLLRGEQRFQKL
jgi:hypothetical protein